MELGKEFLQQAKERKVKFLLPVDHVVTDKFDATARTMAVGEGQPIPFEMMALDIGPKTIALFAEEISTAETIIWNGPLGRFEMAPFANGTMKISEFVAGNIAPVWLPCPGAPPP